MGSLARSADAYRAALKEEWEAFTNYSKDDNVIQILPMTLYGDTAIHIAVYSGSRKPLEDLLHDNPLIMDDFLMKTYYGNTVLHEAVMARNFEAVRLLVSSKPELLEVLNNSGETPLFKAAAFGKRKIVQFLASEPNQMTRDDKLIPIHLHGQKRINDEVIMGTSNLFIPVERELTGTSILHIAIQGEHFGTALELLRLDKSLGKLEDDSHMTCLQVLASMPSAFKSGFRLGTLETILYFCLPIYDDDDDNDEAINVTVNNIQAHLTHLARSINLSIWRCLCRGLPMIKRIWKAKKKHEVALKLATLLIKEDVSWEQTNYRGYDMSLVYRRVEENNEKEQGKQIKSKGKSTSTHGQGESQGINTEIPLLLATKNGIVEIVKEILNDYPQAIDHLSYMGQNILHLAFKHRQKEIFNLVKNMRIPILWLARGIDNDGCTILHHAAELDTEENLPGPALQLQAELKWFKRARKYSPTYYERHVDKKGRIADTLFKQNHKEQLKAAQKWIKETSQSCSAVAVLIATVVFAAAYTVPGGSNDEGIPIFLHSPFFVFFTIMDVISLASSLTSVVLFLSILTSPCEQQDFLYSLPRKLSLGFTLLFFSVATTMLAFAATIMLIIRLNKKQWTTTIIYIAAFFPVTVFALMQFPLYAAFMGNLKGYFKKVKKFVSRLFGKKKIRINMV